MLSIIKEMNEDEDNIADELSSALCYFGRDTHGNTNNLIDGVN